MRATFAYTTARILLFVAATGLIYLAGARGLLLLGLALLVSGAASYILLSRQRDAMAGALSQAARLVPVQARRGRPGGGPGLGPGYPQSPSTVNGMNVNLALF